MKKWLPYIIVLRAFGLRLWQLGVRVIRQAVLPDLRRPGNLVSSLLLLFSGLTEELVGLRREVLKMPLGKQFAVWRIGKRWIKLGVIVAGWVLFILSSWEWEAPAGLSGRATESEQVRMTGEARVVNAVEFVREDAVGEDWGFEFRDHAAAPDVGSTRRWLLYCTMRV